MHKAKSILRDGFEDGEAYHMVETKMGGVWLSDRPLNANEGSGPAIGDGAVVVAVDLNIPLEELRDYEWVEKGKTYRQWLVPADFIKEHGKVRRAHKRELERI
jgi:hypothetical protein